LSAGEAVINREKTHRLRGEIKKTSGKIGSPLL
jgi:hypothetical protein